MQRETAQSVLESSAPTGCFVLVVDNDEISRNLLVRQLSRGGSVVAIAASGRLAQLAFDHQSFDMIFLAPVLPDMDGAELLRIIRQRYTPAELPVIAVTSVTARESIAQCLQAGANDFITKPLEPGVLLRCVETYMVARRSRAAQDWRRISATFGSLETLSAEVFQTIDERVVVWSADDKLVACNRRYRDLFGKNAHEVVPGAGFERLAALLARSGLLRNAVQDPDAWLAGRLARHRESGAPFEEEFSDGSWARITEYHTGNGQIIGLWTDITDVKRREVALMTFAETNRQLASAIDAATSAILITDARRPGNPTVFANPAFSGMTGWPVEEALGRDRRFLGDPDAGAGEVMLLEEKMAVGQPFTMELRLRTRIGRVFWAEVNASPIRDREDRISNWVIIQTDISARKQAQERPGEPRRVEALGPLTSSLAHDLNKLLAVIIGNLESVLDDDASSGDTLRAGLETAVDAARRGSSVADRLLAIAENHARSPRMTDTNGAEHLSGEQGVILLVDQEPQIRAITSIQLRRLGYEVLQADGGPQALDLIQTRRAIDLLVTDIDLSGDMTGVELAARVRGRNPEVRVLYMSGYADGGWSDGESPESRAPFLPKPYDSAALARAVRTALHAA